MFARLLVCLFGPPVLMHALEHVRVCISDAPARKPFLPRFLLFVILATEKHKRQSHILFPIAHWLVARPHACMNDRMCTPPLTVDVTLAEIEEEEDKKERMICIYASRRKASDR